MLFFVNKIPKKYLIIVDIFKKDSLYVIYCIQIDAKSTAQGFSESRLPHFTEEESLEIQGSADFLGFNHYTSNLAYPTPINEINPSAMGWGPDSDVTDFKDPKWYSSASR